MKKIGTISTTKQTLDSNQFHIKKKFGQNFLTDQNILTKISNIININDQTLVLEIGPGFGSLTEHLCEKAKHVIAFEIDEDLLPILSQNFEGKNVTVLNQDFLTIKVDEVINSYKNGEFTKQKESFTSVVMVANLPYYITTPIILKVLEESKYISEMAFMMQKEVADRITSKPSTKDFNSLSVVIQYRSHAHIAMLVPRTVFIPAPNVDSAVVHIRIDENRFVKPKNETFFFQLVRASFGQRRKTLANNLKSMLGIEKEQTSSVLEELDINPSIRAENLSVEQFIKLSDLLS